MVYNDIHNTYYCTDTLFYLGIYLILFVNFILQYRNEHFWIISTKKSNDNILNSI